MNPDELRKFSESWAVSAMAQAQLDAAADAWEEGNKGALTLYGLAMDEIASLRTRLEAAEKEIAAATKWAGERGWIVEPWLERAR